MTHILSHAGIVIILSSGFITSLFLYVTAGPRTALNAVLQFILIFLYCVNTSLDISLVFLNDSLNAFLTLRSQYKLSQMSVFNVT